MRHRPSFPQHDTLRVRFDRRDLALFWGYVQGLDLRELHARYFIDESIADLRHVRAKVRTIAEDLAAAARRTDRPALGGLFLRDPRAIVAGNAERPTLDAFRQRVDPSGEFYREAELQALWREEFGDAAGGEEHDHARAKRAGERRVRLLQRIREALTWIESKIFPAPEPGHRIEAWLPLAYAKRLKAAGITTMGELTERINRGGALWYRHIPGIGQAKALDIDRWLQRHARPGVFELHNTSRMTPTELAQFALTKAPESPVVPLERLRLPAELDGAAGRFRAAPGLCTLSAHNDLEAIKEWIKAKASPHTRRAYQREAERLLLWCLLALGRPMSSMTVADCERYREFVRNPLPAAQWCGPRGTPRWSRAWRPFEGALSSAAERHALIVLKAMGAWLKSQNYLVANPWDALGVMAASRAALDKRRAFTPAQWQRVSQALDQLEDRGARPRLRFALWLLYGTGLRLEEAVTRRVEDLRQTVLSDGAASITLKVVGKGGKEREVPIAGAVFAELQRYFATRGWASVADAPARAFLLARAGDGVRMPKGLQYDPFGAIAAGTLYRQVKAFFRLVAKRCAQDDPDTAQRLRQASTHWLRHTFGTRIATMTRDVVLTRDLLGHASVATTSIYLDGDEMARRDAVEKLMADAVSGPAKRPASPIAGE